jgi:hypothetical protein
MVPKHIFFYLKVPKSCSKYSLRPQKNVNSHISRSQRVWSLTKIIYKSNNIHEGQNKYY